MTSSVGVHAAQLGERPWLPVGDSDVELTAFNGRPSAGLVATDFGAILFWQFFGHGADIGFWVYLPVTDDEAEYIVDHPDEPLLDGLQGELQGRQGLLAVSNRGYVRARGPYVVGETGDSGSVLTDMLNAIPSKFGAGKPKRRHTRVPRQTSAGRTTEIETGSEQVAAAADELARDTLTGCST